MYVTGIVLSATPAAVSASQHCATCSLFAISAIEQPAAKSGKITFCESLVKISALSAMKCTPQKIINSASGLAAASFASLKESPMTSENSITSSRW